MVLEVESGAQTPPFFVVFCRVLVDHYPCNGHGVAARAKVLLESEQPFIVGTPFIEPAETRQCRFFKLAQIVQLFLGLFFRHGSHRRDICSQAEEFMMKTTIVVNANAV
ncbi:MAG: hypothetical protein WBX25_25890 [Rhodomicrobium sp.]